MSVEVHKKVLFRRVILQELPAHFEPTGDDHDAKTYEEAHEKDSSTEMGPHIHAFIVAGEKRPGRKTERVMLDTVTPCYVLVVLQELGCLLLLTNESLADLLNGL